MRIHRFLSLPFILLLIGCRSTPAPAIPSSAQAAPTLTVTPSPAKEITAPTSTPDYSATDYPVQATFTAIAQAVVASGQPKVYNSYPSPDGKWIAQIVIYDCVKVDPRPDYDTNGYEELRLIDVSSRQEKSAFGQLQYCGGLGASGLEGRFWSAEGRYFYYTDAREGVPDGCGYWEKPLLRLEADTLEIRYLGRGPLSPDGMKIAAWQDKRLIVWDVSQGQQAGQISAYLPDKETGQIAWSPDSQALVYLQFESYCPLSGNSYVVRVDLTTFEQTLLLKSESPSFGNVEWNTADELRLTDEGGKEWIYVFHLQELRPLP